VASVDKASLREEFNTLKGEFEHLCANGKMGQESRALFQTLLMLFELLMAVFMEKRTAKNSRNSSLPSSQTDKDDDTAAQGSAKGKGKNEQGALAGNTRTCETVTVATVEFCDDCGEDLSETPCQGHERRTKIDILFEKVVEHVDAQIKQCPVCGATLKGRFPSDLHGPRQYGDGLKAFVINLLVGQMVALKRVQGLIRSMIGELLSEASLLKFVLRLHHALEQWEQRATEQLLGSASLHVDETSLRVNRKNHWIHVYASGEITLKFLHRKRGKEAIEAINIIPRYGGTIIHDCWASYLSYPHLGHGLCGSHLLRELTFINEANGCPWARNIKRLLQETCMKVSKSEQKCLTDREYANLQKRYRNILTRGEKQLPPIPPKPSGKRGKVAKSDAHNLWERLKTHESAVLLFAKDPQVPFTNNRAERDLRMAKVKQKVSGCFRVEQYAKAYCRISSYLQTMANKGHNPLVAIQMALTGEFDL
jgi:transposase